MAGFSYVVEAHTDDGVVIIEQFEDIDGNIENRLTVYNEDANIVTDEPIEVLIDWCDEEVFTEKMLNL